MVFLGFNLLVLRTSGDFLSLGPYYLSAFIFFWGGGSFWKPNPSPGE